MSPTGPIAQRGSHPRHSRSTFSSSGGTLITLSLLCRTSAKSLNRGSALTSASVTGFFTARLGFRSTTANFGSPRSFFPGCFGSSYGSLATSATPTIAFSSPVW
jgi:hypothetical protein